MLSGLRINEDGVTPSCCLFSTFRGEKYVQYYTTLYSRQKCVRSFFKCKNPLLEVVAIIARYEPHSTLDSC
jgi:hypothetical protein